MRSKRFLDLQTIEKNIERNGNRERIFYGAAQCNDDRIIFMKRHRQSRLYGRNSKTITLDKRGREDCMDCVLLIFYRNHYARIMIQHNTLNLYCIAIRRNRKKGRIIKQLLKHDISGIIGNEKCRISLCQRIINYYLKTNRRTSPIEIYFAEIILIKLRIEMTIIRLLRNSILRA